MALIETWLNCDTTKLVTVKALDGNVFNADNEGNLLGVYVSKKGQPVELSGSVIGYVIRPDGETVAVPGLLSGNRAWIVLPQSAYAVVGQISIAIRLVNGSEKTVLAACTGYVNRTTTDTIIDPGHIIPSLEELLAQIEACETATTAATAAAGAANTAASNADAKATLANTAAWNADAKATLANTAAGRADDAAAALENMTGTATGLAAGEDPTVNITKEDGHYLVEFGIPKGDTGEVTQAEFDALAEEVDQKAPAVFKTIESTSIATFDDGADDMPLKDLKVAVEPVQDLHGYDNPWPAGGGKNLFDIATSTPKKYITESGTIASSDDWSASDYIGVSAETAYVLSGSGVPGSGAMARHAFYDLEKTLISTIVTTRNTFTTPADTAYVRLSLKTESPTTTQLELGSTATAYAPYSNICPITGWTGAKVMRTGANLLSNTVENTNNSNGITIDVLDDGRFHIYGTALNNAYIYFNLTSTYTLRQGDYVNVYADGQYSNSNRVTVSFREGIVLLRDIYGSTYNSWSAFPSNIFGRKITRIMFAISSGETVDYTAGVVIAKDSTGEAYEPYKGHAYDITFPSEAGTVYGGTLNPATGELVVDRGYRAVLASDTTRLFGKLNDNTYRVGIVTSGMKAPTWNVTAEETDMLCNIALPDASAVHSAANAEQWQCCLYKDGNYNLAVFTVPAEYDAATKALAVLVDMGCVYCYPLANHITYTFTPQEVTTLLGLNNVWADTGDINLLTYPADTAIKVENADKRITSVLSAMVAPVLTDMIADTALTVNQFRIVNDTLYKVTAPIASGGILTPGTNVIATSIGEQITALLNA